VTSPEVVKDFVARLRHAAAAAEPSACGRGNAVGLTSILDRGQFLEFGVVTAGSQHQTWNWVTFCDSATH